MGVAGGGGQVTGGGWRVAVDWGSVKISAFTSYCPVDAFGISEVDLPFNAIRFISLDDSRDRFRTVI